MGEREGNELLMENGRALRAMSRIMPKEYLAKVNRSRTRE
jgi:hypothetical protein